MADAPTQTPGRMERTVNVGLGLGILFMIVILFGFWVLFIKPLQFAGTAAMNGLNPANQSGAVIEKFDVTINAKGERMVVGQDPQKILEALKEAKPASSAPVAGAKPATH